MTGGDGRTPGPGVWAGPEPDSWMGTVCNVSAFLAGFSLAAVVVIADGPDHFRWPGVAVLALTVGSVVLILVAQGSRWGAYYYERYSPRWRTAIWALYHGGIVALLVGLGAAMAPRDGAGGQQGLRWAATCVAWSAVVVEVVFTAATLLRRDTGKSKIAPT